MEKSIRDREYNHFPLSKKRRLELDQSEKPKTYYKYNVEIYGIYSIDFDYIKKPLSNDFGNGYDNNIFSTITKEIFEMACSEKGICSKYFIRFEDSNEILYSEIDISDFTERLLHVPYIPQSSQRKPCSIEVNVKNLGVIEYNDAFQARLNAIILRNKEKNRIFDRYINITEPLENYQNDQDDNEKI